MESFHNDNLDQIMFELADMVATLDVDYEIEKIVIGFGIFDMLVHDDNWLLRKDLKEPLLFNIPVSINYNDSMYTGIQIKFL